jgi:hypothetical protein
MWRKKVDKSLRPYLEKFIEETNRHRESYEDAEDSGKAQLWIAISLLSKHLYNIEMKLNYLEKAMKDLAERKESEKFLREVEQKVKGKKPESKVEKEAEALKEGASLLSEIARKKVKKKKKKRSKKK